jgi:hypothetical protein
MQFHTSLRNLTALFSFGLACGSVAAQDPVNGAALYQATIVQGSPSCANAQCHGSSPALRQNRIYLGSTAADIRYAIAIVPKMGFLVGKLSQTQLADLAAYIADPTAVSSRTKVEAAPAIADFGGTLLGAAWVSTFAVALRNVGTTTLKLADISVSGESFSLAGGSCTAGLQIDASRACKAVLSFSPRSLGALNGELRFAHDGEGGVTVVPLRGSAVTALPPNQRRMVEFVHAPLGYYFQTSRLNEQTALDGVEDFQRTGESYPVFASETLGLRPLSRFFFAQVARNGSRGSHFYTLLESERTALIALNPSNAALPRLPFYEGTEAWAREPESINGIASCPAGFVGVFRAFRGNANFPDDPNHRFTASAALYARLQSEGWDGEGIGLCVPTP